MGEPVFFAAGRARQFDDVGFRPGGQGQQHRAHFRRGRERVHPRRPPAQFAGRLRAAQQQLAQERQFGRVHAERLGQTVDVLHRARAHPGVGRDQLAVVLQDAQALFHLVRRQVHFGIAVVLLVAGGHERVERQGIVFGRGEFLLDEAAEEARFQRGQVRFHGFRRSLPG